MNTQHTNTSSTINTAQNQTVGKHSDFRGMLWVRNNSVFSLTLSQNTRENKIYKTVSRYVIK